MRGRGRRGGDGGGREKEGGDGKGAGDVTLILLGISAYMCCEVWECCDRLYRKGDVLGFQVSALVDSSTTITTLPPLPLPPVAFAASCECELLRAACQASCLLNHIVLLLLLDNYVLSGNDSECT